MAKPLNATLYRRLARQFGRVKISNAGQSLIATAVRGIQNEPRLLISHSGEYYQVCCPYCGDTRRRLYVNHMFGKTDGHGRRMTYLAVCYNEGCLLNEENKMDFLDHLDDTGGFLEEAYVDKGVLVPEEAREVQWPGPCRLLADMKPTHKSRAYLTSRGFDSDYLSRKYQVSFCTDSHYFLARERIIIPIFEKGKLKGWQARYIGELDWKDPEKRKAGMPPKYYSCPDSHFRSRCIYSFDVMREWETGVIVEGPTDVWRFGSMSGCIFGNSMTEYQKRKFLTIFRKRTAVLLLDPEEYMSRSTRRLVRYMERRMPGRFCAVRLPTGTDPGSMDRSFLREYVRDEAKEQGVKVSYRKAA